MKNPRHENATQTSHITRRASTYTSRTYPLVGSDNVAMRLDPSRTNVYAPPSRRRLRTAGSDTASRRAFTWPLKAIDATVTPQTSPNDRTNEYVPVATATSDSGSAASVDDNVAVKTRPEPPEARIWKPTQSPVLECCVRLENRPTPTALRAKPAQCTGLYRPVFDMNAPASPPNGMIAKAKGKKYTPDSNGDAPLTPWKYTGKK